MCKSRKEYFKYISSMLDEIFYNRFNDMSKYILIKNNSNTSTQIDTSSLPRGSATWTSDNNVYVESNVSTKLYQDLCPIC
jgi:hypothetical protein